MMPNTLCPTTQLLVTTKPSGIQPISAAPRPHFVLCYVKFDSSTSFRPQGLIHKCSKAYAGQYLETYIGHSLPVYALRWNPFHPHVFLSCSADWTVRLWDQSIPYPILTFDLSNPVGDIAWAPLSSTVFAAVTSDGKVRIFDLVEDKYNPICEQKVVKRSKLTHICFNPSDPIIIVGDDRGGVNSLRLSPNLRISRELRDQKGKLVECDPKNLQQETMSRVLAEVTQTNVKDRL